MGTRYSLAEALKTKELAEALERCACLWKHCDPTAATRVQIFILTSHADVIRTIAELLPMNTRGFQPLGSEENLTTSEVISRITQSKTSHWDGSFSGEIGTGLVDEILEKFRKLKADPLRRTSFQLSVKDARWKGAHAESVGDFMVDDTRVFKRKIRFRISATHFPAPTLTGAAIQTELNDIFVATGLDFRRGQKGSATTPAHWDAVHRANAALLFDHCVELVSGSLLRDGFDWRELTGVFAEGYGVSRRFEALALRIGGAPFRWETRLNQFMKRVCPAFRRITGIFSDAHTFARALEAPWKIAVVFDTHPGLRIGRVFKLRCAVIGSGDTGVAFKRSAPMLRCSGGAYTQDHDWCPEFSYNSESELELILTSLEPFLRNYLERFEARLNALLLEGWQDLESVLPESREVTAREADRLARDFLTQERISAGALIGARLIGGMDLLLYRSEPTAQISDSGRSNRFYHWVLDYELMGRAETVTVPYAGLFRRERIEGTFSDRNPREPLSPIGDGWCDSDEAVRDLCAKRDELVSRYPEMNPVIGLIQLTTLGDQAAWTGHIEFSSREGSTRDWVLVSHAIDARTRKQISTTFDERFENRPKTRELYTEGGPPPGEAG